VRTSSLPDVTTRDSRPQSLPVHRPAASFREDKDVVAKSGNPRGRNDCYGLRGFVCLSCES